MSRLLGIEEYFWYIHNASFPLIGCCVYFMAHLLGWVKLRATAGLFTSLAINSLIDDFLGKGTKIIILELAIGGIAIACFIITMWNDRNGKNTVR